MGPCNYDDSYVATLLNSLQETSDSTSRKEIKFGLEYLRIFGYLNAANWHELTLGDIADALVQFQQFFGLPENGQMDSLTTRAMAIPRCGVPDVQPLLLQHGPEAQRSRWNKRKLTYFIENYVSGLSKTDVDDILSAAWKSWSDVCDLTFTRVQSSNADIIISTGKGRRDQFDGSGGTLAWAYLPPGNDQQLLMRFDMDETWLKDGARNQGIYMLNVAAHEFGHLIGLDHSKINGALMAPFYNPGIAKPQPTDDITRIQAIYGPAQPVTPSTPPAQPTPTPVPPTTNTLTIKLVGDIKEIQIPGYRVSKLGT